MSSSTKRSTPAGSTPSADKDSSVGPMYRFERSLPHLPVPTLEETATRYLKSLRPYHLPSAPGTPNEPLPTLQASEGAVGDFLASPLVKILQERLLQRAEKEESWLSAWWNEDAYFGWRGALVPGVNYFFGHVDDKTRTTGPARAAGLIRALLYFRKMTETQQLEPEMARTTPMCMASYKYLFNATRLPTSPVDTARKYDSDTHNHVVVVRKNKFYEVPVVGADGEWLSEKELEVLFKQVIVMAGETADSNPLGALTAADRDLWTTARQQIVAHAPQNAASLERIESAIIIVSLDSNKPLTKEDISRQLWVGDGQNRWFDKHQLVVFDNGKSGFNGEHSCMDGTPTSRLNDWLIRSLAANKIPLGSPTPRSVSSLPSVQSLEFDLPTSAKTAIATAIKDHHKTFENYKLAVLQFDGTGKDQIKKFKLSPDSYTQLVMQLAFYKMKGELAPTYESAQTRKYKLGRTEVIRSATEEALVWCKAMEDPTKGDLERSKLMQAAAAAHIKLAGEAADGRGVDRHLYGLKKLLQKGEELPALYTDPTFAKSANWVLSTSQLSSPCFTTWGYGAVVDEGYGLAYSVNDRCLRFTVTSTNPSPESVFEFKAYLEESCTDVRDVMEKGIALQADEQKAKL